MSIKLHMPLQIIAVFWRNTEKSEAAHCSGLQRFWLYLILTEKLGLFCALKFNFKWVIFKCFFFFLYGLKWLKALILRKYTDGRCGYRETWFPSLFLQGCLLCHSFLSLVTDLNTIYLFSETRRGYREADVSEGSFKHSESWIPFDLIASVFWLRLQSVVQKSFGPPQQESVTGYYLLFNNHLFLFLDGRS